MLLLFFWGEIYFLDNYEFQKRKTWLLECLSFNVFFFSGGRGSKNFKTYMNLQIKTKGWNFLDNLTWRTEENYMVYAKPVMSTIWGGDVDRKISKHAWILIKTKGRNFLDNLTWRIEEKLYGICKTCDVYILVFLIRHLATTVLVFRYCTWVYYLSLEFTAEMAMESLCWVRLVSHLEYWWEKKIKEAQDYNIKLMIKMLLHTKTERLTTTYSFLSKKYN